YGPEPNRDDSWLRVCSTLPACYAGLPRGDPATARGTAGASGSLLAALMRDSATNEFVAETPNSFQRVRRSGITCFTDLCIDRASFGGGWGAASPPPNPHQRGGLEGAPRGYPGPSRPPQGMIFCINAGICNTCAISDIEFFRCRAEGGALPQHCTIRQPHQRR